MIGTIGSEDDSSSIATDLIGEIATIKETTETGGGIEKAEDMREGDCG